MQILPLTATALNDITSKIVASAIEVHRAVGPGLLESAYRPCLACELRHAGLHFMVEVDIPLIYKDTIRIDRAYVADFVVEDAVIVEVKAIQAIPDVCRQQLSTYLRLADCRVGLLLNFGAATMTAGIQRVVHRFPG